MGSGGHLVRVAVFGRLQFIEAPPHRIGQRLSGVGDFPQATSDKMHEFSVLPVLHFNRSNRGCLQIEPQALLGVPKRKGKNRHSYENLIRSFD
jgi:hypothetical protein